MPDPTQADVIVPVYADTAMTMRCVESVLAHGGSFLRSLMVRRLLARARHDRRAREACPV